MKRIGGAVPWLLAVLVGAFLFAGLVWLGAELKRDRESLGWPSTTGRIVSARVSGPDADTGLYYFTASYEYVVGDRQYTSYRLSFGLPRGLFRWDAEEDLRRYPAGTTVPVHYDPNDPGTSVLWPGFGTKISVIWLASLPAEVILIVTLALVFNVVRKWWNQREAVR